MEKNSLILTMKNTSNRYTVYIGIYYHGIDPVSKVWTFLPKSLSLSLVSGEMLETHTFAQLCATTCHMVSCGQLECINGPCGDTL